MIPKRSIQQDLFLEKFPSYDGRGIIVGILDTGIDPGAAGLQMTSDGKPKIIDLLDCTGSGDVDMKTKVTLKEEEETIVGLTGRVLRLGSRKHWPEMASSELRIGKKNAYELFAGPLVSRIKAQRKKKWEADHLVKYVDALSKLETAAPEMKDELQERVNLLKASLKEYQDVGPTVDVVAYLDVEGLWRVLIDTKGDGELAEKKPLTNFRAEREYAKWDDVTNLNYAVNIFSNGDLVSIVCDCGSHGTHVASICGAYFENDPAASGIAPGVQLISLRIGDNRLGSMETGSAIARALSAAATAGCNLINMSFGEPTTTPGGGRIDLLMRELVLKHHVIFVASSGNTGPCLSSVSSPGGTSPFVIGVGAFVSNEMMKENYFMRENEEEKLPNENNYTWSARGPTFDGQLGVSISAPGGAIASIPQWNLSKSQLMNGTSMSSPSCCGGIALILSGLRQRQMVASPARIRRCIENTAKLIDNLEMFAQGHGLIQLLDAFELAQKESFVSVFADVPLEIRFPNRPSSTHCQVSHGLLLREFWEVAKPSDYVVEIHPIFSTDPDLEDVGFNVPAALRVAKADQAMMQCKVILQCSAKWVNIPDFVLLTSKAVSFKFLVNPTLLEENTANFCEICGYDEADKSEKKTLFRIPITVIKPITSLPSSSTLTLKQINFDQPGKLHRTFVKVPRGASWLDVKLINEEKINENRLFALHVLQLRPGSRFREDEMEDLATLHNEAGSQLSRSARCVSGGTIECCVGQYWSALGRGSCTLEISFHGMSVSSNSLCLSAENGFVCPLYLKPEINDLRVEPSAEFTRVVTCILPNKTKTSLKPLFMESRNAVLAAFPPQARPTFELLLFYEYSISAGEGNKFKAKLPLRVGSLLYDSPYESQMIFVLDAKLNKLLGVFDYGTDKDLEIPKDCLNLNFICSIRHESLSQLERLQGMGLLIDRPLGSNSYAVGCFGSIPSAVANAKQMDARLLKVNQEIVCYFALREMLGSEEMFKKLPSWIKPGDLLTGAVSIAKKNSAQLSYGGEYDMPKLSISFVVPQTTPISTGGKKTDSTTTTSKESFNLLYVKARLDVLKNLDIGDNKEKEEVFFVEVENTKKAIDSLPNEKERESFLLDLANLVLKKKHQQPGSNKEEAIIRFADEVVSRVNLLEMRARRGLGVVGGEDEKLVKKLLDAAGGGGENKQQPGSVEKEENDAGKVASLLDALHLKAHALLDLLVKAEEKEEVEEKTVTMAVGDEEGEGKKKPATSPSGNAAKQQYEAVLVETYKEIVRWTTKGEKDVNLLYLKLRFARKLSHFALAIKYVDGLLENSSLETPECLHAITKLELMQLKMNLFEDLGFDFLKNTMYDNMLLAFKSGGGFCVF